MALEIFRSPDGRYRTQVYIMGGVRMFALAEKTMHGVLITDFSERGEVLDQVHRKSTEPMREIVGHVQGVGEPVSMADVGVYEGVSVDARCNGCGERSLRREMEMTDTRNVANIPVVPIFVCTKCKKKHYSMTDSYLKLLISRNAGLFEDAEERMRKDDEAAFVGEIREYMARIFASKKIALVKIASE